jgi:prepilin-type N-terminal cleavage/methylation domain-containing protein
MSNTPPLNSIRVPRQRSGFTLVELMVVIVIISILGSIIMFAMFNAQDSAREAKTRNMIAKLHALVMARYESYMSRRVPVPPNAVAPNAPNRNQQLAFIRLQMLREMMRMEMPDRWTDVQDPPVTGLRQRPAVNRTYQRKISAARVTDADSFQGAECLYMIVASGLEDADAITQFSQSDIGDTDNDGLPEFLDGWGRPIRFIRWPAGFDSQIQSRDETKEFDQFNSRRLIADIPQSKIRAGVRRRFALFPLIYSGGADRKFDITTGPVKPDGTPIPVHYSVPASGGVQAYVDPYLSESDKTVNQDFQIGEPSDNDGDGSLDHGDNIHNHNLTVR